MNERLAALLAYLDDMAQVSAPGGRVVLLGAPPAGVHCTATVGRPEDAAAQGLVSAADSAAEVRHLVAAVENLRRALAEQRAANEDQRDAAHNLLRRLWANADDQTGLLIAEYFDRYEERLS